MSKTNKEIAMRVSINTILLNAVLSIGKLFAGILGHSNAMISDSIHSASDVFSTLVVIAGITLSNKSSDKEHPYGHERLESIAALLLAIILLLTGAAIGVSGIQHIFFPSSSTGAIPGKIGLLAAFISIVVKELMYWYTRFAAKKIHSPALLADAWHHRSDALSSIGSLIGIFGSRMGFPVMDSIASVIICLFILKVALSILKESINQLIDRSCDDCTCHQIECTILEQQGVISIDSIKTRLFGSKMYLDVEIVVLCSLSVVEAHSIAENVHDAIETSFPNVKHCMVHVNPSHS